MWCTVGTRPNRTPSRTGIRLRNEGAPHRRGSLHLVGAADARDARRQAAHPPRPGCCNRDKRMRRSPAIHRAPGGEEMKVRRPLFLAVIAVAAVSLTSIA